MNNRKVSVSCFIGVFIHYENKKQRKTILIFRQEKRFEKTISKNDFKKRFRKNGLEKRFRKNGLEKRFEKNDSEKTKSKKGSC